MGGVLTVSGPHWVCPRSRHVCFPIPHCSGCSLFCWKLSEAGPGLHALPRSKPLRFRFLGTPQNTDSVGPAFCALPRSEQLRCLVSTVAPSWGCVLLPPPSQQLSFLGVQRACLLRCAMCLFWGADLCDPPGGCRPSRIPRSLG